jgi:hypothetical protein
MDSLRRKPLDDSILPEAQTELRWSDSELWPVRRPYPVDIPCPVCGTHTRCDFFGLQSCPHGHSFGQRTFWSGDASSCSLLLEDLRDGRMFFCTDARLHWRDDARVIVTGSHLLQDTGAGD